MNDSVKFIFKTLFKVPIIILASYIVFNLFGFGLTYFKMLGVSYVVMQTAVENNYIPEEEMKSLREYLSSATNSSVVENASIIVENNTRKQYGQEVTVGVSAHYKFIWPLMPNEQLNDTDKGFVGNNTGDSFTGFAGNEELTSRRENIEAHKNDNITIVYTVPGLQYYADLE